MRHLNSCGRVHVPALRRPLRILAVITAVAYAATDVLAQRPIPRTAVPRTGSTTGASSASSAPATVAQAFRAALGDATVRSAARVEILRQLRQNRPLMSINGTVVTPIDYGSIYKVAAVRGAMVRTLGASGPSLIATASADTRRIGLVFTPANVGPALLGDFTADLTGAVGPEALRNTASGLSPGAVLAFVEVGSAIWDLFQAIFDYFSGEDSKNAYIDPEADTDGDGLKNKDDLDDDGDGTPDNEDRYPQDADRQICDCGRPAAGIGPGMVYVFGDNVPDAVVAGIVSMYGTAISAQGGAVTLGAAGAARGAMLSVMFGPSVR